MTAIRAGECKCLYYEVLHWLYYDLRDLWVSKVKYIECSLTCGIIADSVAYNNNYYTIIQQQPVALHIKTLKQPTPHITHVARTESVISVNYTLCATPFKQGYYRIMWTCVSPSLLNCRHLSHLISGAGQQHATAAVCPRAAEFIDRSRPPPSPPSIDSILANAWCMGRGSREILCSCFCYFFGHDKSGRKVELGETSTIC